MCNRQLRREPDGQCFTFIVNLKDTAKCATGQIDHGIYNLQAFLDLLSDWLISHQPIGLPNFESAK